MTAEEQKKMQELEAESAALKERLLVAQRTPCQVRADALRPEDGKVPPSRKARGSSPAASLGEGKGEEKGPAGAASPGGEEEWCICGETQTNLAQSPAPTPRSPHQPPGSEGGAPLS